MDTETEKRSNDIPQGEANIPARASLIEQFQAGDSGAASTLFDRYVARLIALAKSRLCQGMRRRVDPEDVVNSAYRSFFLRAADGDFELQESGDLWRLLAQITLNKVRRQAERDAAARRDFRRDEAMEAAPHHAAREPSPDESAALIEQVRLVAERLSGDERLVLTSFLQGESVDQIAARLSKSPRTVRRALARARTLAEQEIFGQTNGSLNSNSGVPALTNPLPYSDFRLERLIGAGGMGKVYRATQASTGESVAVKALRKDMQDDARTVRQFLHEAEVAAELDHPGIIRVRGLGRFPSGGYFIVMEWIEGVDLQARLDQRLVRTNEGVRIVEAVAEAVLHSHRAGVVHCDLKPANILLGRGDRIVVTDFGFAQLVSTGGTRTAIGGTLGYLAPELLHPRGVPTPASDVYSLGKLLEQVAWGIGPSFAALREQSLATDPARRPQTVDEFLKQLRQAMADQGDLE